MYLTCECAGVLQVKPESVRAEQFTKPSLDNRKPRGELVVYEKINFQSSISKSMVDWALLSEGQGMVLAVIEAKCRKPRPLPIRIMGTPEELDVRQLACYVLVLPAYFLWGILKRTDPIVALLLYPNFLLRLTFRKPTDIVAHPFGIQLTIEGTDNSQTAVWALKDFLSKCVELYRDPEVRRMETKLKSIVVHPSSWSSVNVNLEDGMEQYKTSFNLGFLFRTDERNLRRLLGHELMTSIRIPEGGTMIVKCLVAIVDLDHVKRYEIVEKILSKVEAERREAELRRVKREAERREAELKRVIQLMIESQGKESSGGTAAFCFPGEMDMSTGIVEDLETAGSGNFESKVEPSDATPGEEIDPDIKIPYLFCCRKYNHKLITIS